MRPSRAHEPRAGLSIVLLLVAVVVVAVCATGGLFIALSLTAPPETAAEEAAAAVEEDPEFKYDYVPFGVVVANLAEERLTRYAKLNLSLQVRSEHVSTVQALIGGSDKAVFQDWLLSYMSDKRLDDVKGAGALAMMREDILDGFNQILAEHGEAQIEGVLFTEFNVQ